MLTSPWTAALVALFLWWFSTGVILWVVKSADRYGMPGHRLAALAGLPLIPAGVWLLKGSLGDTTALGVYRGFVGALAIWGWIELAFLTGLVAGPVRHSCPVWLRGWQRFLCASGTLIWHEKLLAVTLLLIVDMSLGAANLTGLATFGTLFFARISAKLNLFFGVPRVNTEFLPKPLAHLPSYFRIRPASWFFPVSITALTFTAGYWIALGIMTGMPGYALLAAITTLALLEHWLMVVPLPDAYLWRWMIPTPETHCVRDKRYAEGEDR
ncbi:MAG: DUF3623 domain-containing protein [Rhodobacteraceae bacterium]|nr:DUF3623 domain-containing protein [Paracoccaceae bacterium]